MRPLAYLRSVLDVRARFVCSAAVALVALCCISVTGAYAQSSNTWTRSILDEVRLGVLAHDIEPNPNESGVDFDIELLFKRPAATFRSSLANILLRPRFHVGASINFDGDTNQVYAGLTWDIPLAPKLSLEVSFGGALHDGPTDGADAHSYGCAFNFRESISLGYQLSDRWRVYGTVTHMSNAGLCDFNSGLTSSGVRFGYTLN
jgi:lipid A 3-O-deacylase